MLTAICGLHYRHHLLKEGGLGVVGVSVFDPDGKAFSPCVYCLQSSFPYPAPLILTLALGGI